MSEVVLRCENVKIGYGRGVVVRSASLTVGRGEFIALCGVNGAGKSSVLKAVAGVIPTLGGKIDLFGSEATGLSRADRLRSGVGFAMQGAQVFSHFSVRQCLQIAASAYDRRVLGT